MKSSTSNVLKPKLLTKTCGKTRFKPNLEILHKKKLSFSLISDFTNVEKLNFRQEIRLSSRNCILLHRTLLEILKS